MTLENPFLIRELRQLGRRPRAVQVALGSAVVVMGAVLLFWVALASNGNAGAFGLPRPVWDRALLWILGAAHIALCGIAAGYGGYRLLAAEHYRSTLDSIQLLPYHPLRWLGLKLAFPALGVVIAWITGFPFYFLAALCNLVPLEGLFFSMHKPLLAGAGIMVISLLTTPDYLQRTKQAQTRRATGFRSIEGDLWVWTMLVTFSSFGLGLGIVFGEGLSETVWLWGGFQVPEAIFWLVGFVAVVPAAFLTAITAVVKHEKRERIAHFARLVALAVGYYLAIGFYWAALATWMKWGLLLVVPMGTAIMQSRQGQRRESGQSEKYVQWIAARCDNALLLRDLRVYSRFLSVRRYALWTLCFVLAWPLVVAGLSAYLGAKGRFLSTSVGWVFFQIALQVLIAMWGYPKMQWHKEQTGKTLSMLLITPLTSREILLGRLLAVPAYYWVGLSPVLLILFGGIVWAMWQGYWVVAPLAIAIAPLFLSFGVWMCCSPAVANPFSARVFIGDVITILLRLLQTILLAGCLFFGMVGFDARTPLFGQIDPLLGWVIGVLLGLGNAVLCWVWFRLRVRQLDTLRQGDMEVPDSKELAPPPRRRAWKFARGSD